MAHISQKAAAISLGVKAPSVSGWESGATHPTLENLKAMAALYRVSVDYLLGVTDIPDADAVPNNKKEPTVSDDGLRVYVVSRIQSLSDPALARVCDFLSGLEAGQAIGPGPAAAPGSDDPPAG